FASYQATFSLGAGATFSGNVVLDDADLTLGADVTVPAGTTFTQQGFSSVLRGAGDLVVEGQFDWTSGTQRGPGHTVIIGTAVGTIAPIGTVELRGGRGFDNDGHLQVGAGAIGFFDSSSPNTFENSGTLELIDASAIFSTCCDGPPQFGVPS